MPKLEVVNANNVIEFNPQKANFKLKNTGGPKGESGAEGPRQRYWPRRPASRIQGTGRQRALQASAAHKVFKGPAGHSRATRATKARRGDTGATGATGPQGPAGQDGVDGFSPIATVTQEGLNAEISITDKDGRLPAPYLASCKSSRACRQLVQKTLSILNVQSLNFGHLFQCQRSSADSTQGQTSQQTYTGRTSKTAKTQLSWRFNISSISGTAPLHGIWLQVWRNTRPPPLQP